MLIVMYMQGFFDKQDFFWTLSSLSVHFLVVFGWLMIVMKNMGLFLT